MRIFATSLIFFNKCVTVRLMVFRSFSFFSGTFYATMPRNTFHLQRPYSTRVSCSVRTFLAGCLTGLDGAWHFWSPCWFSLLPPWLKASQWTSSCMSSWGFPLEFAVEVRLAIKNGGNDKRIRNISLRNRYCTRYFATLFVWNLAWNSLFLLFSFVPFCRMPYSGISPDDGDGHTPVATLG